MLHPCFFTTLVNRQRQAGTHEGISSTRGDEIPDRDLYADHVQTCQAHTQTSGELRVALFLCTSLYAVSHHRSLSLAHGHTETHTHTPWQNYTFSCPVSLGT